MRTGSGIYFSLWDQGASASKVRNTLSVLEVTKRVLLPNRPPFLDNGIIRSFMEAARVDRPIRKKGPNGGKGEVVPYFDVAKISSYWSHRSTNAKLPLYNLRKK